MNIFFLLNPSRVKNRWALRNLAARHARRSGWEPRFGDVDRAFSNSTARHIDQALDENCQRIVIVGGDGSLHRAINHLAQKKKLASTELALVPAGTCNDFARFMGLRRRRLEQAFRLACSGKAHPIDLGSMDGELFLNNAGFGRRPDSSLPRTVRAAPAPEGWPGQPVASRKGWRSFQALRAFRPTTLRARWDNGSIEGSFYMVLACNAPFFSGGLHFSKKVDLHDGMLDVYLMPAIPKWKLLPLLALGRLGRAARFKRLVSLRVPRLDVETDVDMWPQADGEPPAKAERRVSFSVSPEKAMIVTPPSARFD